MINNNNNNIKDVIISSSSSSSPTSVVVQQVNFDMMTYCDNNYQNNHQEVVATNNSNTTVVTNAVAVTVIRNNNNENNNNTSLSENNNNNNVTTMNDNSNNSSSSSSYYMKPSISSLSEVDDEILVLKKEKTTTSTGTVNLSRTTIKMQQQRRLIVFSTTIVIFIVLILLLSSKRIRRSLDFWRLTAPIIFKYQWIKFYSIYIQGYNIDSIELNEILVEFHECTAPIVLNIILYMGGVFVKLGQVVSTVGTGFVPDPYVTTLRPLQDGVPPRNYDEIVNIIESSTKRTMDEIFINFNKIPLGAASIAQVHKATLRYDENNNNNNKQGEEVIIKVQYPDVAELFAMDFYNIILLAHIINPENLNILEQIRQRNKNEIDFTIEAKHLREIRTNMQKHNNIEPKLVRIPRVMNETGICNKYVLAIEYLDGISMKTIITQEQQMIATALGLKDGVNELRQQITARMRESHNHEDRSKEIHVSYKKLQRLQRFGPITARFIRWYGSMKQGIRKVGNIIGNNRRHNINEKQHVKVNLGKALKTLIHVHGLQMLYDGVFNVDPHPGNVLILPDGRLGLLDYGMIGRISDQDRYTIAESILALAGRDKTEIVRIFQNTGYRIAMKDGTDITDVNILHRLATLQLDRLDLSPVTTSSEDNKRRIVDIVHIVHSTVQKFVPTWMENASRMSALMLGTAAQLARPMSLSREWKTLAKRVLQERDYEKTKKKRKINSKIYR